MNILYLCVGPSGSGKTTFARQFAAENNIKRFNADEYRAKFGKDESDQSVNNIVFSNLHEDVRLEMINNKSLIVDNTNYNGKNRKQWVNLARQYNYKIVCFILTTSLEQCLINNKKRARFVPEDVIKRQFNNLTIPKFGVESDYNYYIDGQQPNNKELFNIFNELNYDI